MRPLKVAGLDLSTAATALASTHDKNGVPFLSVFTIPGTAVRPLHEQIAVIEKVVRRQLGGPSPWPDLVMIEGTFTRMSGSDYPLHALHANLKQWLWRQGVPYVDVSPSTLKVWATGSGATRGVNKVTKDKVVEAILSTYGSHLLINPRDDNQCDAVALLTMGLSKYGQGLAEVSKNHRRALSDLTWPALDLSEAA